MNFSKIIYLIWAIFWLLSVVLHCFAAYSGYDSIEVIFYKALKILFILLYVPVAPFIFVKTKIVFFYIFNVLFYFLIAFFVSSNFIIFLCLIAYFTISTIIFRGVKSDK